MAVSRIANEVRAREWKRSHYQLRTSLNEIVSLGGSSVLAAELMLLRDKFSDRAEESLRRIESCTALLSQCAERQEFTHLLRTSLDLVRYKARFQANRVIVQEINGVLQASGVCAPSSGEAMTGRSFEEGVGLPVAPLSGRSNKGGDNVVPLRAAYASAGGAKSKR